MEEYSRISSLFVPVDGDRPAGASDSSSNRRSQLRGGLHSRNKKDTKIKDAKRGKTA